VKRLILLIAPVVLVMVLAGSFASVVSDTDSSLADSNAAHKWITTNQTQASNSSASATITITMYTGDGE
jgi:hypothetical protein